MTLAPQLNLLQSCAKVFMSSMPSAVSMSEPQSEQRNYYSKEETSDKCYEPFVLQRMDSLNPKLKQVTCTQDKGCRAQWIRRIDTNGVLEGPLWGRVEPLLPCLASYDVEWRWPMWCLLCQVAWFCHEQPHQAKEFQTWPRCVCEIRRVYALFLWHTSMAIQCHILNIVLYILSYCVTERIYNESSPSGSDHGQTGTLITILRHIATCWQVTPCQPGAAGTAKLNYSDCSFPQWLWRRKSQLMSEPGSKR